MKTNLRYLFEKLGKKLNNYFAKAKSQIYDNKKVFYGVIIGGVSAFAILLIIVGIAFGSGKESEDSKKNDTTEVIVKPSETEKTAIEPIDSSSEIAKVIVKYYGAKASADIEKISECVDNMNGISENTITSYGKYIEAYQDIQCYEIKENSNICKGVVFITFKYKYTGIATPAPGYSYMQIIQDTDGNYKIHNMLTKYELDKLQQLIDSLGPESQIRILEEQMDKQFQEAYNSDEDLRKLYDLIKDE